MPLPESTLARSRRAGAARCCRDGAIDVRRGRATRRRRRHERSTPSTLQVILGALRAACEEMGAVLIRSAHSANIKERRDASTALFDAAGEMVDAGRAHPRAPRRDAGRRRRGARRGARAGRAWVLNDPYAAARTCPTSPSSRRSSRSGELLGFAANRAHHADVGGPTPGSMPADSRTLDDEGVVIEPQLARRRRRSRALAAQMRQPDQRRADLRAQLAANRAGARRVAGAGRARSGSRRCARRWRRCSTTPSGARARASPRCRTASAGRATCSRRATGDLELRLDGDGRGRAADARLRRQRARSTTATSTARSRSRARPATSRCACSPTRTSRRAPAPTGRSRCARRRARC